MKTPHVKVLLSAAIVLLMAWAFASCKSKDNPTPTPAANTVALATALDTANHYITVGVEGTAAGDYTVGSKASLQSVTTSAQAVLVTPGVTQSAVDAATTALNSAITAFKAARIQPIDPSDLIAFWTFDDGTGTTAKDASTGAHNGTLMIADPSEGTGGLPTWVADRKGVAAKALHFTGGGHVEVPVSTAFNPASITVSVWVNLDSMNTANGIYSDNYIISQNDYHGYKLQTQSAAKPFFTVATTTSIYDKDTNDGDPVNGFKPSLYLKRWYYVAVTYTDGTENFYINGNLTKQWLHSADPNNATGPLLSLSTLDLFCIGAVSSNAFLQAAMPDYVPGHFLGSMDELRIYKTALSGAQISAIYAQEKP